MKPRHDDPAVQTAYAAWTDSTIHKAEHVLDCKSGCTDRMMACLAGMLIAEEERAAWGRLHDVRQAEVSA